MEKMDAAARAPLEFKKAAVVLIDGGYLSAVLIRLHGEIKAGKRPATTFAPRITADNIGKIARACVIPAEESLRRIFYYDCEEFDGDLLEPRHPKYQRPCLHIRADELRKRRERGAKFHLLNPGATDECGAGEQLAWQHRGFSGNLLRDLETMDFFAVRRGRMRFVNWENKKRPHAADKFLAPKFEQKGVDIKIGLDIASISLNRHAERIILVTGDTDFIPAMKFCRRHGVQLALVQLAGEKLSSRLTAHSDFCRPVNWPRDAEAFDPLGGRKAPPNPAMREALTNARRPAEEKTPPESGK